MYKRQILTFFCLIISLGLFAGQIVVGTAAPVKSLRKAIEMARPGDTIRLQAGLYKEGSLVISKPLTPVSYTHLDVYKRQVNGDNLTISVKDGKTILNGSATIVGSVRASNGWVHVIDGVLLPPAKK